MTFFLALDHRLFLMINHLPHTPFTDAIAMTLSGVYGSTTLLWLLFGVWLFVREERKSHWFFAPLLTAALTSGLLTNVILKPFVERLRPSLSTGAIIVQPALYDYSFPSGHATLAFAMAMVLSAQEPKWKTWFYLLAALIALSRIYLGVHYPMDIIVGALLGWGIGFGALQLFSFSPTAKTLKRQRCDKCRKG
ncbi:phosphatase PAP2 family protein [Patescibacteria group bacterium]|nr:phosphatase PAP2 family protein [Patescibacteria group bacterium]MBU1472571.1 phosphatase PAP2 family protein [Patescibacteria group bacterium]MBU2459822.1 phosphatase PAP2 family protein [Patescibacteria group bacterium]MBU2544116.1 phosphatase PAP2 family protein [Patescibacteria group bacterium]